MSRRGRKSYEGNDNVYFITTTVMNFDRILTTPESHSVILIDSLKHQISEHRATLFGYVFMPSHTHLVLYLPGEESLSDFMRDFKKYTSYSIYDSCQKKNEVDIIEKLEKNSIGGKWKLWMDRFDSQILYTEKFITQKIDYIHNNPVKAGLVKEAIDWKYSSARNYYLGDHSIIEVATDWAMKD